MNKEISTKRDYFWNTMAGLLNAAEAVIMSMIITRITNLKDAGYVAIAFAIGNMILSIGKYGTYNFRVTDHLKEYSFKIYLNTRVITTSVMLLCLAGYLIYGYIYLSYNRAKTLIILFIGLIYVIESFENLLRAQLQYVGLMYLGSILFIIRWLTILTSFGISLYITKNASTSLCIAFIFSTVSFIFCFLSIRKSLGINDDNPSKSVISLLKTCFPLFLSMFLSFFITNSSKYAIEFYMDAPTQACFSFISMPVFFIQLLTEFVYSPQLVAMTSDYNEHKTNEFKTRIRKQYIIIVFLTLFSLILAYTIGIPFLSVLYHTDLNNYLPEFLVLITSGGFLALSGYQCAILTIIRCQKYQIYGYIPVSVLALLFVGPAVKIYGTQGAAFAYLTLTIILCILYQVFIHLKLTS